MRYPYRASYAVGLRGFSALLPKNRCGRVAARQRYSAATEHEMSARKRQKPALGAPLEGGPKHWVQTERAAHAAWAALSVEAPRAAGLLHYLVSVMGHQNAVVISQKNIAAALGCSVDTVQRSASRLVKDRWIQIVQLGSTGTVNAYVVNDQVAWGERRDLLQGVSVFSAQVVATRADQPASTMEQGELRRVPALYPAKAAAKPREDAQERASQLTLV